MESKVETLSLKQYLKQGFKEIINRINGHKEETDLSKMTDIVDEETLKVLTDSLAQIDANAQKFEKQLINEEKDKKTKRIMPKGNKEAEQQNNYQVSKRDDKGWEIEQ